MWPRVEGLVPLLSKQVIDFWGWKGWVPGSGRWESKAKAMADANQVLLGSALPEHPSFQGLPSPTSWPSSSLGSFVPHLGFNWSEPTFPSPPADFLDICHLLSVFLFLLAPRAYAFFCFWSFNCHLMRVSRVSRLKGLCLIYHELPLCWFL